MYQNLISTLHKILESDSNDKEKLLKISTLVDFADGLEEPKPRIPQIPQPQPQFPPIPNPTVQNTTFFESKKPAGAGPLVGVEDIK